MIVIYSLLGEGVSLYGYAVADCVCSSLTSACWCASHVIDIDNAFNSNYLKKLLHAAFS